MFIVVYKHALKNAVIPVLTVIGLQTGLLLGGAILTETIFSWPGLVVIFMMRLASGIILLFNQVF